MPLETGIHLGEVDRKRKRPLKRARGVFQFLLLLRALFSSAARLPTVARRRCRRWPSSRRQGERGSGRLALVLRAALRRRRVVFLRGALRRRLRGALGCGRGGERGLERHGESRRKAVDQRIRRVELVQPGLLRGREVDSLVAGPG